LSLRLRSDDVGEVGLCGAAASTRLEHQARQVNGQQRFQLAAVESLRWRPRGSARGCGLSLW
jgi:hypothetical protein